MAAADQRKVAFVTGASSGIGRATAAAFTSHGYATLLVDRDEGLGREVEAKLRQTGECAFVRCDVTDDDDVRRAVEQAISLYGRLDAVFNAAGIDGAQAPVADSSRENWDRVIGIDLTGVWSCMRHQIPALLRSGGGSIVNCASVAGVVGAPALSAYVAAKHGVIGLTKAAALEYARQGIRVNAVCPGMIETPMQASLAPELKEQLIAMSPMGRYGQPEEIASMVLAICENGSFVTGQAIVVDGGWVAQ
jgi:NAD(P)-dependent dehydrogenase (short-subunit alcohol dehydrogenase family)